MLSAPAHPHRSAAEHAGTALAVVADHRSVLLPLRTTEPDRVVAVHR